MSDPKVEALLIEADKRTRLVKGDEFDEATSDLMKRLATLESKYRDLQFELNDLKNWKMRQALSLR